jgi:HAE1 family hydrophobic/amphiphilic exporter-1
MKHTELFIRRPALTMLVTLALLLFGIMGYRRLPVRALPHLDFPTILVSAHLPGASPDTRASAVATPLERQVFTSAGLDAMTSTRAVGLTPITLPFHLSRTIDAAAHGVQAAMTQTIRPHPPRHAHAPDGPQRHSARSI